MNKPQLFFDTADVEYCKKTWETFAGHMSGKELVGITTNPNALHKVNCNSLLEMETVVNSLCKFVSKIRKDDLGVVYVQLPNSNMSIKDSDKFIELVKSFSDDKTKVALKIPPFKKYLDEVERWSKGIDVNVTGVADCSTALKCFTYDVRYVSIIPGRMEERGIDADAHLAYTNKRKPSGSEIIAGSMRTIEGLRKSVVFGTVPTVGSRVLDQIKEKSLVEEVIGFWSEPVKTIEDEFSPEVTFENKKLSVEFFEQMDSVGMTLFTELKNFTA